MRLAIVILTLAATGFAQGVFTRIEARGIAIPSPRADGPVAYDPAGRQLILFGGTDTSGDRNDLWAFSTSTNEWRELRPDGEKPAPRHGHTLIYDAPRRRVVAFAGQAAGFFNDVWAYDIAANRWQRLSNASGPSPRYAHSAVVDNQTNRMIVSHGFTSESGRFDDTWAFDFDTNRWTNLTPTGSKPLRRCLHHAVLDESSRRMLLYGGCASAFGPCPLGDLWSFDLGTNQWRQINTGSPPPARERYGVAYDPDRRILLLYGGSAAGLLSDVWHFDVAANSWLQVRPSGDTPDARRRHEATFIPDLGAAAYFGGDSGSYRNDLILLTAAAPRPRISANGIRNVFTGEGGGVAPGQIVSVYGSGFGREALVTVNGIPATVLFANETQINARIPSNELAGEHTARFVATANGSASAEETVQLVAAAPGLFGNAIDIEFRLVTEANPASAGAIVLLFGTGEGSAGGNPIRVELAGRTAEVLYAGAAPGIPGLFQVNARIPDGVTGSAQLVLFAGNRPAPPITVFVR